MRYYYKTLDNKGFMSYKSPLENLDGVVAITKEEWNEHMAELEEMENSNND